MAGIFIGVMAGAFLLCGLVNALFLGKYYLNNKKEVMIILNIFTLCFN